MGTALNALLPNPENFGLDFALVAMFIGIFSSQFTIMLRRVKIKKLFFVLGVVGFAYLLLTMLLQNSLAVLFATGLGGYRFGTAVAGRRRGSADYRGVPQSPVTL